MEIKHNQTIDHLQSALNNNSKKINKVEKSMKEILEESIEKEALKRDIDYKLQQEQLDYSIQKIMQSIYHTNALLTLLYGDLDRLKRAL